MLYNIIVRESGGTGRRARLRGVWFYRTGSIPVSRTRKQASNSLSAFLFLCGRRRSRTRFRGRSWLSTPQRLWPRIRMPPLCGFCVPLAQNRHSSRVRHYLIALWRTLVQIPVSMSVRVCHPMWGGQIPPTLDATGIEGSPPPSHSRGLSPAPARLCPLVCSKDAEHLWWFRLLSTRLHECAGELIIYRNSFRI